MSPRRRDAASAAPSLDDSAPVFAALGDGTRLRLVARLCAGGPMSIAALTSGTDVTRQAVTKHLHVLEDAGLVAGAHVGRETLWALGPARLAEARRCLDRLSAQWDVALQKLRAFVEDDRSTPATGFGRGDAGSSRRETVLEVTSGRRARRASPSRSGSLSATGRASHRRRR